jgi:hypothetical protein
MAVPLQRLPPLEVHAVAEVLVEYSDMVVTRDGRRFGARACGGEGTTGLWQGWLEFTPLDGGPVVRTGRETTQPNRKDAIYWATGITGVYLEGALGRALTPLVRVLPPPAPAPAFDGPAPNFAATAPAPESILNPFSVYRKGEELLRNQLGALSAWHLVNIIGAYALSNEDPAVLSRRPSPVLVETIVAGVRARRAEPARS